LPPLFVAANDGSNSTLIFDGLDAAGRENIIIIAAADDGDK
jgi:hypothetical protein